MLLQEVQLGPQALLKPRGVVDVKVHAVVRNKCGLLGLGCSCFRHRVYTQLISLACITIDSIVYHINAEMVELSCTQVSCPSQTQV